MIGWPALTFAAMRSASLKVPQSRFTVRGAPSTLSPEVGICDWLSAATAAVTPSAPIMAIAAALRFQCFFIYSLPGNGFLCRLMLLLKSPCQRDRTFSLR